MVVDSHSLVSEKYREMFPEYDRGFINALTSFILWTEVLLNPLNTTIKIWILICCPYSFPTEVVVRSW